MNVSEELKQFRSRFPGCRILLFADLSTGMVLANSTGSSFPQEYLDGLCARAARSATGLTACSVGRLFGKQPADLPVAFLSITADKQFVFVVSTSDANEALCFELDFSSDAAGLLDGASELLERISVDE